MLFIAIVVLTQSCVVSQKSLTDSETNERVTIVRVNAPSLLIKPAIRIALKSDSVPKEVAHLVRKIKHIKVFTVENASHKMIRRLSQKYFGGDLQDLVLIRSEDTNVRISTTPGVPEGIIGNLFIVVKDDENFTFIKVKGNFPIDDIAQAINAEGNKLSLRKLAK